MENAISMAKGSSEVLPTTMTSEGFIGKLADQWGRRQLT
jgi:hypothetical protein